MAEIVSLIPLLQRCQRQDRAAFTELFTQYHRRVLATAFYITQSRDAADEIAQLVFLELFSALRRFDLSRPFLPWLYRIVHNISMDYLKQHYRHRSTHIPTLAAQLDILAGQDGAPGPDELAEQAEIQRQVWDALNRLTVKHRAVLVLRYYGGLREGELAEALRCRRGTIKSRLHRAHQALAAELMEMGDLSPACEREGLPAAAGM